MYIEAKFFRITKDKKRRKTSKVTLNQFIFPFQHPAKFTKNSKAVRSFPPLFYVDLFHLTRFYKNLKWEFNRSFCYFCANEMGKSWSLWFDRKKPDCFSWRLKWINWSRCDLTEKNTPTAIWKVRSFPLCAYFDKIFQESDISFVRSQPQLFPASDRPEKASTSKVRADASSQIFEQFLRLCQPWGGARSSLC